MTDRPLTVLYVVPDLGVGGAERHATTLLSHLDRSRFTPSVICLGREGAFFADLTAAGIPARALHRAKSRALSALVDLVREMRRASPDIVIVRGYSSEILGRIAAVIAQVPHVVVWVHNCGDIERRSLTRRFADRLLRPGTTAYFGVAHAQVEYLVDELHHPPGKVRVIHNGVDPALFDPAGDRGILAEFAIAGHDPVVGILAALRPEKDHAMLLRAARMVVDELPHTRVLIIGDGPQRGALEKLTSELGLVDNVVFTGSRSDGPALLGAVDVFVLSSYSIECFPMALLEAMAAGRPAVCTAVGGIPEMISDGITGHLVPPRDAHALAKALVRVLSDPARAREMGRAARARVENEFSLRRSVDEAQSALEQVAGRGAGSTPVRLGVVLDLTFVGGVEILLLNLFRNFDPMLVQPRLICLREAGPLVDEFRAAGFGVEVLERTGRYDLRTLPRLIRSLRRDRTDAVLVTHHHRASLALGRVAARLAGVPVNVVAAHDMELTSVGNRVLPRWAVNTMFLSDALVLLSPRQGAYLRAEEGVGRYPWQRTRNAVIPNGITLPPVANARDRLWARREIGLGEEDFAVGIVARLSAQKAHQVLLQAFSTFVQKCPHARLVVIGDGEREGELRSLAATLGIAERTKFAGFRRDAQRLLPGLDVSCLSSVHEGVPMAIIESMAAGLPVVATRCGSVPDMIVDGVLGYLVPVGDADALAQRLLELAQDRNLRARMGRQGRAWAEEHYRIEGTARGYERLLTELVSR
ncbi:glycosyltransferase [Rhodococcus koreensis]|uniref:glycosyltransferase n=1 Tax=Rhodococcus koreensis TaxID=99653 RepID=UPI0036D7CC80